MIQRNILFNQKKKSILPSSAVKGSFNGQTIGLLGGSFNPAHAGHKMITEFALKRLRLNTIWWLVSTQNPLKSKTGMRPLIDRLNTAQSIANHPKVSVAAFTGDDSKGVSMDGSNKRETVFEENNKTQDEIQTE